VANVKQKDVNQNFIGDECEKGEDYDRDGFLGEGDNCPKVYNANQLDSDKDGKGDLCDDDLDGDGVPNSEDNCPMVWNKDQKEGYHGKEGRGMECENDFDGDGVVDSEDICPENKKISKASFKGLETMDLCVKENITTSSTKANTCAKPRPEWDLTDDGKEIYQGRNSRVSIAVAKELYGNVEFSGNLFVGDQGDNDWVGVVWGMIDINNFYMLVANRQKPHVGTGSPLYWNIKKIEVEKGEMNDPKKFDKMINAIKASDDIPGYSKVLWTDPKKQQWKPRKSIKWNILHSIRNSEIRLKMFEATKKIIDAKVKVDDLQGGRLGVFCMSQEKVTWSAMELACTDADFIGKKGYDEFGSAPPTGGGWGGIDDSVETLEYTSEEEKEEYTSKQEYTSKEEQTSSEQK